ncbi:serine hydrolase domain-containing protein [Spongiactinospora sp. 9N601]|uniref:serine hydrolase domain-containing protein n=1 Tax=Spongiactinospora sp. 9N601 TaxID=3375149 RepID=UPI00379BCFE2
MPEPGPAAERLGAALAVAVPGVCAGAVAAVAVRGRVVAVAAGELVRYRDAAGALADDRPRVRTDSIFDLASVTKIFTTVAILSLVEQGLLSLDEPVAARLPAGYGGHPEATLRHLLTHTAGLPAGRKVHEEIPGTAARMELILSTAPVGPCGGPYLYSDIGMITAGRVAELAAGVSLADLVRDRVTGPLGLASTGYRPPAGLVPRIAATEYKPGRPGTGCVRGEVHDETAYGLGGVAGHAGLFATAGDVLRLGEALRMGGGPVLSGWTVAEMTRDQGVRGAGFRHGLGVRIGDPAANGPLTAAFGHSGFTGTALLVAPAHALTVVLLTNHVHPVRGRPGLTALRHTIATEALHLARMGQ